MRKVADLEPQRLAAILVDAARYRWLRENLWAVDGVISLPDEGSEGMSGRYMTGDEFDIHIDAELASE